MADPSETTQVSRPPGQAEDGELLDAVRALATQVGGLQAEVHALRSQPRTLPADDDRPGWDDAPAGALRDGGAWVRSLDAPSSRHLSVPWLLLELLFLVAVAVLAAVAGFDTAVIVGLMLVAWLVVAAAEWAAARAARRRHALTYGPPMTVRAAVPDDPSWFEPPSERTALDVADGRDTAVTRLPPPAE